MKKSFYSTSKFNIVKQCCGVAPIRLLWALVGREFKKSLHSSIIRQSSSNSSFILTKSGGRFRLLLSTVIMFAAAVGNMTKFKNLINSNGTCGSGLGVGAGWGVGHTPTVMGVDRKPPSPRAERRLYQCCDFVHSLLNTFCYDVM